MKRKLMTMIIAAGAMLGAWAANVRLYVSAPSAVAWGDNWYCYAWDDGELLGGWPGTKTVKTETRDGVTWHYWDVTVNSDFCLILNDGSGKQTGDFAVTGVSDGKAYFIEVAKSGGNHSCQIVNVGVVASTHNKVQLWENGPYWAETNIGAEEPWDSGYYFWWGDTNGYKRVGSAWVASDDSVSGFSFRIENAQTYNKSPDDLLGEGVVTADYNLAPAYDAAQVQWGGGWRMPTYDDLQALCDSGNCDWTWVATNGVNGYIVSGKGDYASNSIFLPIVGYGDGTALENYGFDSCYWISGVYADNYSSRMFELWKDDFVPAAWNTRNRHLGFPIRPVQNAPAPANQWTSGDCTVTLDTDTGTLTVSGDGAMADEGLPPWKEKSDDIKKIVIEDGVTAIGIQAFSDFREVTSVQIGKDVVGIGGGAFYDCTSLSGELALPNGLTAIGDYAFCQCQNLSGELLLPNGLITVEMYAFFGCKNFTTVKIPSTVTNIGAGVFALCTGITDVYCHPNAADLTWGGATSDFKSDGSTKIHVKESQLAAYQEKFPAINATFVGDLPEFEFTTDGDELWTLQGDGSWYSGRIPGSNGDNWLTTTVTGPGILSFDWKILGADVNSVYIECYVDDERVGENYDEDWQTFTHELGEGEHSVKLYYCEDGNPSLPGGAWMKNFRVIQNSVMPDVTITEGAYFKATLAELGYDVPTDGQTAYSVKAYGLPAGLKLVGNKAVTKKDKKGKKVVVTPANVEWWIEGVPTAALDYATNPPYLVITTNGVAQTLPLSLGVEAQDVMELDDLALGDQLNEQFYLPGVTNGWTVSGLPTGLKYTPKLVTTTKKKGKKIISVTTNALPYSVYGKTTKAGLFTITAKKKAGAYNETMKYRVLVTPAGVDTSRFTEDLTNITTMAYVKFAWYLTNDVSSVSGKVAKVTGLPAGLTFAASDVYGYANAKKKTGKYVKQPAQTIMGTPTKPGTYVVTFTKNETTGTGKKKKTVAKTAQILWTVTANDAELSLGFNTAGGEIKDGSVGLNYGDLLAFSATDGAKVTASGLPKGITLADLGGGSYAFRGFTAKAGTYLVTVKATLNGKTVTQRMALKVDGLPAWAKGTYNGIASADGDSYSGIATITVSSAGKISGKFTDLGTNWTFSAASYTSLSEIYSFDAAFICSNVVAKYAYKVTEKDKNGKKKTVAKYRTRTFKLAVVDYSKLSRGMAYMSETGGAVVYGYQNLWGQMAYKTAGKKLFSSRSGKKTLAYKTWSSVEADGLGTYDTLSVKVTTAGALTATYKYFKGTFDKKNKPLYATYTCATTLIPVTPIEAETNFYGAAYLYFAPDAKTGFSGYGGTVAYPFVNRAVPVPTKAALATGRWYTGEFIGDADVQFPVQGGDTEFLYGIVKINVGGDLKFTGTFTATDGTTANFSGTFAATDLGGTKAYIAEGVKIKVRDATMTMRIACRSEPYADKDDGFGMMWGGSEPETGNEPVIYLNEVWQNIWKRSDLAAEWKPGFAEGVEKAIDLVESGFEGAVAGDALTYSFGPGGAVSVTGAICGEAVSANGQLIVSPFKSYDDATDSSLLFIANGRLYQQRVTFTRKATVAAADIELSADNFIRRD